MNPVADQRLPLLYYFCRIQRPRLLLSYAQFVQHAQRMYERSRHMLLSGARFLARSGRTREGIFFYKEIPISDTPHPSTAMLLGPLVYAFEETGDATILDAGYRLFRWLVDEGGVATYMLKDLFTFMPLLERLDLLAPYRGVDVTAHLGRGGPTDPAAD